MFTELIIGAQYKYKDQVVELAETVSSSSSQVRVVATKQVLTVPTHEIEPLDKPVISDDLAAPIKDEDWDYAKVIRAAVSPYLHLPRLPAGVLKQLGTTLNLKRRQIQNYIARLRARDSIADIARKKVGNKEGSQRLDPRVEKIIDDCMNEYYLKRERKSLRETLSMVELRCMGLGLRVPSYAAMRRRRDAIDPYELMKARYGARAANQRFQLRPGKVSLSWPLQLVQIDHTQADLIILSDDEFRIELGRPWVTLAIDVLTRCIVGFYLSLDHPSTLSVGMCIAHALLPKDEWLRERGIDADWPFYGRIATIGADNAMEFLGYSMARACDQLKTVLKIRGVGRQWKHGHVERLMGTSMRHVHGLPGTTYSNPKEKGDYDSAKMAKMTLAEAEAWLIHDICHTYHHSLHEGIGTTPAAKWEQEYKRVLALGAEMPAHLKPQSVTILEVLTAFLPQVHRRVTRAGVEINRVFYSDDAFAKWVGTRKTYPFKYDPRDITVCYGRDPSGVLRRLVPTDSSTPRMSLHEWNLRRDRDRAAAKSPRSIEMRTKGEYHKKKIIRGAIEKTRKARQAAAREAERLKGSTRSHGEPQKVETSSAETRNSDFSAPVPNYRTQDWDT